MPETRILTRYTASMKTGLTAYWQEQQAEAWQNLTIATTSLFSYVDTPQRMDYRMITCNRSSKIWQATYGWAPIWDWHAITARGNDL